MHNWIAWCPSSDPELAEIGAVLCHPDQKLDRDTYLYLVGERIQRIVDFAADPAEAADALQNTLLAYGLGPDLSCPPDKAADWFVRSNPGVEECLERRGLLEDLRSKTLRETPAARAVIESDAQNDDAIGWLHMWAWRLSTLP